MVDCFSGGIRSSDGRPESGRSRTRPEFISLSIPTRTAVNVDEKLAPITTPSDGQSRRWPGKPPPLIQYLEM